MALDRCYRVAAGLLKTRSGQVPVVIHFVDEVMKARLDRERCRRSCYLPSRFADGCLC